MVFFPPLERRWQGAHFSLSNGKILPEKVIALSSIELLEGISLNEREIQALITVTVKMKIFFFTSLMIINEKKSDTTQEIIEKPALFLIKSYY